jgi:hypothetical protein
LAVAVLFLVDCQLYPVARIVTQPSGNQDLLNRLKRVLTSVITIALLSYVGVGVLLFLLQDSMLFLARSSNPRSVSNLKSYQITIQREQITLQGWLLPAAEPGRPTIIYYGGNGEELSTSVNYLAPLGDYNYLYVNYRGYGDSLGKPGQEALYGDAVAIIDQLSASGRIDPDKIVLIGRSLGSSIAIYAASQRSSIGLVLVSPFDSLAAVGQSHYPIFPVKLLMRNPFPSIDYVAGIEVPTLIIMAENDNVVPRKHSLAVVEAWRGPPTTVTIPATSHNDISGRQGEFFQEIGKFLASLERSATKRD